MTLARSTAVNAKWLALLACLLILGWVVSEAFTAPTPENALRGQAPLQGGGYTVAEPASHGAVDLSSSSIEGSGDTATINLVQRSTTETDPDTGSSGTSTTGLYARVTGVNGKRPTFRLNKPPTRAGDWRANNELIWRYAGEHRWRRFTRVSGGVNGPKIGRNSAPFAQDAIIVAFRSVPYTLNDAEHFLQRIVIPSGYAYRLPSDLASSSTPAYTYGRITGANHSDFRGLYNPVPDFPLYGFGMRDDGAAPPAGRAKAIVVLTAGVHAGEDWGSWMVEAAVQRWISDPALRARLELHVYPLVGPGGRETGRRRGVAETRYLGWDMNRKFIDGDVQIEEAIKLKAALIADGFGDLHVDGHTHQGGSPARLFVWREPGHPNQRRWLSAMNAHMNTLPIIDNGATTPNLDMLSDLFLQKGVASLTLEFDHDHADAHALADDAGSAVLLGARTLFDEGHIGGPPAGALPARASEE